VKRFTVTALAAMLPMAILLGGVSRAQEPASEERMNARKEVAVNNDGYSMFYSGQLKTKEDLQQYVHQFKGTDVTIIEWCLGPSDGSFTYDTKVGQVLGRDVPKEVFDQLRRGDRLAAETVQRLIAEGNDPLRIVAEQAKADGIALFASMRMGPFYAPPYDVAFNGRFYRDNQDKRIVLPGGRLPIPGNNTSADYSIQRPNLSYAYPEVQEFFLDVLEEAAQRDIMGVNLDYLRNYPFFGFEEPLVAGFKRRYGIDPPGPDVERWWRYRAEFMTDFLRKLRARLDEAEQRLRHPIRISARIDYRHYLEWGLDIETWIKEGLLDILIVSKASAGGFPIFDLAPFRKMVEGTNCKLLVGEETVTAGHDLTPEEDKALARGEKLNLKGKHMTPLEFCRRALRWYTEGADGVEIFNAPGPQCEAFKVLGSLAKVKEYLAKHGRQ